MSNKKPLPFFYEKDVRSYITQFLADGDEAPPNVPVSEDQIINHIRRLWLAEGRFLHPTEMKQRLLEKYTTAMTPSIKAFVDEIEGKRYNDLDRMSAYMRKAKLGVFSGLAHWYAQETGRPACMMEVDFSNMGGTNLFFGKLLARAHGYNPDALQNPETREVVGVSSPFYEDTLFRLVGRQSVFSLTDGIAGPIAKIIHDTLQWSAPPDAQIYPIRSGGDELRLIATGVTPGQFASIINATHDRIEDFMARLGLHHLYGHTKYKGSDLYRGFGAAVTMIDLADRTRSPLQLLQEGDQDIRRHKTLIALARLNDEQDDAVVLRVLARHMERYEGDIPPEIAIDPMSALIFLRNTFGDNTMRRRQLYAKGMGGLDPVAEPAAYLCRVRQILREEQARIGGTLRHMLSTDETPAHSNGLFLAPQSRREQEIALRLAHRQIGMNLTQSDKAYLGRALASISPHDPATDTWTDRDMPETVATFAADMRYICQKAMDTAGRDGTLTGTQMSEFKDLDTVLSMQVRLMALKFHNLAGLNKLLGHANTDIMLHYFAADVLEKILEEEGLIRGDYQISHYGGGEFILVFMPYTHLPDGRLRVLERDVFARIEVRLSEMIDTLNGTDVKTFCQQRKMTLGKADILPETFAKVAYEKNRDFDGMRVTSVVREVPLADEDSNPVRGGAIIEAIRSQLETVAAGYKALRSKNPEQSQGWVRRQELKLG